METETKALHDLLGALAAGQAEQVLRELESTVEEQLKHEAHCLALNSPAAALQLCLGAFGIQPGEIVLLADLQEPQVINPVIHVGARPVLLDVQADSLALDPNCLASWLEQRTIRRRGVWYDRESGSRISAVVFREWEGLAAPLAEYAKICRKYDLLLIESGARHCPDDSLRRSCCDARIVDGDSQPFALGAGALLLTRHREIRDTARSWANLCHRHEGGIPEDYGFQYRMPALLAGIASWRLRNRAGTAGTMQKSRIPGESPAIKLWRVPPGESNSSLMARLFEQGWITRELPSPLSANPIYADFCPNQTLRAEAASHELVLGERRMAKMKTLLGTRIDLSEKLASEGVQA